MATQAKTESQLAAESAWADQAVWSETASTLRSDLARWRTRAAVAGVVGALLETLAGVLAKADATEAGTMQAGTSWWAARAVVALLGAIVLAVVPYVTRTKTSTDRIREWVRSRSASESLKEQIYRYLVGTPPYDVPARAPTELFRRTRAIKDQVRDLSGQAAVAQPTGKARPLSPLTPDDYADVRVKEQIDNYYAPKARTNAAAARRLHNWEFALGLTAVVMGAAASAAAATGLTWLGQLGPWVAVVTTAGAAVTTHLLAARYDHSAMTYFATADRLKSLRDEWRADSAHLDPPRVAQFVQDCEDAISSENQAWMAAWTK